MFSAHSYLMFFHLPSCKHKVFISGLATCVANERRSNEDSVSSFQFRILILNNIFLDLTLTDLNELLAVFTTI